MRLARVTFAVTEGAPLERKIRPIEEKQVQVSESTFEGFSAGIGNLDEYNDVIEPGAFARTIRERLKSGRIKLLNGHNAWDTRNLWGTVIDAEERAAVRPRKNGPTHLIWSKQYVSRTAEAQEALLKLADEPPTLDSLSIGYEAVKVRFTDLDGGDLEGDRDPFWEHFAGRAIRHIDELKWWETSLVTFGANLAARTIPGTVKELLGQVKDLTEQRLPVDQGEVKRAIMALERLFKEGDGAPEVLRCVLQGEGAIKGDWLDDLERAAESVQEVEPQDGEAVAALFARWREKQDETCPRTFVTYAAGLALRAAQQADTPVVPAPADPPPAPDPAVPPTDPAAGHANDGRASAHPTAEQLHDYAAVLDLVDLDREPVGIAGDL